jgi:hypothetical protein
LHRRVRASVAFEHVLIGAAVPRRTRLSREMTLMRHERRHRKGEDALRAAEDEFA